MGDVLDQDLQYRKQQAVRTREYWKQGIYSSLIHPLVTRICRNSACKSKFKIKPYEPNKFCSHSCAATVNNRCRRKLRFCKICNHLLKISAFKYCSLNCQQKDYYNKHIDQWKLGFISGNVGIKTKSIAHWLKKYLIIKYNNKCSDCGWHKVHPVTKTIPLEVNHIDGNADNNSEENLQILCPNCHSLTLNFRNLNKGNGRSWRRSSIAPV